jgi:hypothetical protein
MHVKVMPGPRHGHLACDEVRRQARRGRCDAMGFNGILRMGHWQSRALRWRMGCRHVLCVGLQMRPQRPGGKVRHSGKDVWDQRVTKNTQSRP